MRARAAGHAGRSHVGRSQPGAAAPGRAATDRDQVAGTLRPGAAASTQPLLRSALLTLAGDLNRLSRQGQRPGSPVGPLVSSPAHDAPAELGGAPLQTGSHARCAAHQPHQQLDFETAEASASARSGPAGPSGHGLGPRSGRPACPSSHAWGGSLGGWLQLSCTSLPGARRSAPVLAAHSVGFGLSHSRGQLRAHTTLCRAADGDAAALGGPSASQSEPGKEGSSRKSKKQKAAVPPAQQGPPAPPPAPETAAAPSPNGRYSPLVRWDCTCQLCRRCSLCRSALGLPLAAAARPSHAVSRLPAALQH
jgi:hypothetical protein